MPPRSGTQHCGLFSIGVLHDRRLLPETSSSYGKHAEQGFSTLARSRTSFAALEKAITTTTSCLARSIGRRAVEAGARRRSISHQNGRESRLRVSWLPVYGLRNAPGPFAPNFDIPGIGCCIHCEHIHLSITHTHIVLDAIIKASLDPTLPRWSLAFKRRRHDL